MATTSTVILLIGLPGSGKSTVARALCEAREDVDAAHIEYDKVAASISAQSISVHSHASNSNDEDIHAGADRLDAWKKSRIVATEQVLNLLQRTPPPSLIVMDDNFHLRSMRKTIYRICQEMVREGKVVLFGIVFVNTPIKICLARNEMRTGDARVLDGVIEKMATTMESPDGKKAAWEAGFISVDGGDTEFDIRSIVEWTNLLEMVELPPPVQEMTPEEIEIERQATAASRIHRLDLLTRKWVAEVAKVDRRFAGTANNCRKELLQSHRSSESVDVSPGDLVHTFCEMVCTGWEIGQRESLERTLVESLS